jgi:hypothetical protein
LRSLSSGSPWWRSLEGIDTIDPPYYTLGMSMGKRKRAQIDT